MFPQIKITTTSSIDRTWQDVSAASAASFPNVIFYRFDQSPLGPFFSTTKKFAPNKSLQFIHINQKLYIINIRPRNKTQNSSCFLSKMIVDLVKNICWLDKFRFLFLVFCHHDTWRSRRGKSCTPHQRSASVEMSPYKWFMKTCMLWLF